MSTKFLKALESRYQSKVDEAVATIELYLSRSAGIGEHPDIIAVLDEYVSMLETNSSKLEIIKRVFVDNDSTQQDKKQS
jgi:DNA segregation ATPase FtsK/SpoIIIE-like protein